MFPNSWERSHFSVQKTAGKPLCKSPTSRFRTSFLYHKTPIYKSQYIFFMLSIFWWHFQFFNPFFYKSNLIRGFYSCRPEISYFRRHSLHAFYDQMNRVVVIGSSLLYLQYSFQSLWPIPRKWFKIHHWQFYHKTKMLHLIICKNCKFRPNGVRISLQAVWVFQFKRCGCFGWTVRTCVGCDTVFPAATAARKKHHFRCKTAQPSLASLRCAWMASVFLILIVVMQLTL